MDDSLPDVQVYDGDGVDHRAAVMNRRILPGLYAVATMADEIEINNGLSECAWTILVPGVEDMPTFDRFQERLIEVGGPLEIERLEIVCFRTTFHFDNLSLIDAFWLGPKGRWCLHGTWRCHGAVSA